MKKWPKDLTEVVYFDDLVQPVKKALLFVLKKGGKKIADDVVIPYKGYNIGRKDLVTSFDPVTKFSTEQRNYDRDEQGRDIFDLLIGLAVQLGIEQGRRWLRKDQEMAIKVLKNHLSRIETKLEGSDEDVRYSLERMRNEIEWISSE